MATAKGRPFLHRLPFTEQTYVSDILRMETVGGALLLLGAVLGMVWINSPWGDLYTSLRDLRVGPSALHLDLSLATWAADGLLAIFFFVVGLELKRELAVGDLSNPSEAILPIIAAVCGVAAPAVLYVLVNLTEPDALRGWAIPAATDIAFALAVLAVIGRHLPSALRAFLLTLAIVDDLIAILIIALFYTSDLNVLAIVGALAGLAVFYLLHRAAVRGWYLYVPLAVVIWALVHESGIHATVAGVAMAMCLRVKRRSDEKHSPAEQLEHKVRPLSAGFAVPVFALLSAGVAISVSGLGQIFTDRASLGVVLGLVVGKIIGVFGGSFLAVRLTRATLNPDLAWVDVFGLSILCGIGFTVSLLIGELSFDDDPERLVHVKAGILAASLIASLLAAIVLRLRNRVYRQIAEDETRDSDADGIPDVYEEELRGREEQLDAVGDEAAPGSPTGKPEPRPSGPE